MRSQWKRSMITLMCGTLAAALLTACAGTKQAPPPAPHAAAPPSAPATSNAFSFRPRAPGDRVRMELYVMSKCPFAVTTEQGLSSALEQLGDWVDLHIDYIVMEKAGAFQSLHGDDEVRGNMLQLCAAQQARDHRALLRFINCQNVNLSSLPAEWEKCAELAGLAVPTLRRCADGEAGRSLLRSSMQRSATAHALGSPTIVIAGQRYEGGRDGDDFAVAICAAMKNKAPACSKLPEDVEVEAVVLSDRRCATCSTERWEGNLQTRFFPKLKVRHLDWSEPETKKLYAAVGGGDLPIFLFKAGVEKARKYDSISRWLTDKAGYKQLRVPAEFDPTAEICDNKVDDNNDGKVDCADPTCRERLVCRKEIKLRAEVFVMSQCPYAAGALLASEEVMRNFKGKVKLEVHYVAGVGSNGEITSMHGESEVAEDLRQVCARKHYPAQFLSYVRCRAKNQTPGSWRECAKKPIRAEVMERCAEGAEGKALLSKDVALGKTLRITASPTWLANNRYLFNGVSAEVIKKEICSHNPGLVGCDHKLSEGTVGAGNACGQ